MCWYCQHYDTHRGYVWVLCDLIKCRLKYGIRVDEYFRIVDRIRPEMALEKPDKLQGAAFE